MNYDHAIIGDGVIGLSIAYELSQQNANIVMIAPPTAATTASQASAGMLPPADYQRAPDVYERLRALSLARIPLWCEQLKSQTGLDPEWIQSGAIQVATSAGETAALSAEAAQWLEHGIVVERLEPEQLLALEPNLELAGLRSPSFFQPQMAQLSPRKYLPALAQACGMNGVTFLPQAVASWTSNGSGAVSITLEDGQQLQAGNYCVAAGVRSPILLELANFPLEVPPWRGQMLLLEAPEETLRHIVCAGQNYLVPRRDGTILVGSTMEEAGLDAQPTDVAIDGLRQRAESLVPVLAEANELERWAGLRPGTRDGYPFLGPVPGHDNLFVATGHFRHGISLSAGTAVVMAQLLRGEDPELSLDAFRVGR